MALHLNTRLLVLSFLTRTIGDNDAIGGKSGRFSDNLLLLCSTWYLTHGSNCHDTVYKPVQNNDNDNNGL